MKMLYDRVMVEIEKLSDKSDGGIYLNPTAIEKQQMCITKGKLFKIGAVAYKDLYEKGLCDEAPKIGDTVHFKKYSGILHYNNDESRVFRVIESDDIYAFGDDDKDMETIKEEKEE